MDSIWASISTGSERAYRHTTRCHREEIQLQGPAGIETQMRALSLGVVDNLSSARFLAFDGDIDSALWLTNHSTRPEAKGSSVAEDSGSTI